MGEIFQGQVEISQSLHIDSQLAAHLLALNIKDEETTTQEGLRAEHPNNLRTAKENVL